MPENDSPPEYDDGILRVREEDYEWIMGLWHHRDNICPECGGGGDAVEGWECELCGGDGLIDPSEGLDPDDPMWEFKEIADE